MKCFFYRKFIALTPVSTSMQVLPPNDIMRPSGLYNKLRPRLPGSPPFNPYGSKVLRSVKIDKDLDNLDLKMTGLSRKVLAILEQHQPKPCHKLKVYRRIYVLTL
uniref:Uncharacterized protein n=1 Tax=Glossina pallidipes TaxID=7398 RepID=A0A1A9ZV79_GLOPL